MNSSNTPSLLRRSALVTLLAGAALLLSACSTASVSSASIDKASDKSDERAVAYSQLHKMMVTLVQEPELGSEASRAGAMPTPAVDLTSSSVVATNP